jgi:hypothetical protein
MKGGWTKHPAFIIMITLTLFYGDDIYSKSSLISVKNLPYTADKVYVTDEIAEKFKITKVPQLRICTNTEVCRIIGNVTRDYIISKIQQYDKVDNA